MKLVLKRTIQVFLVSAFVMIAGFLISSKTANSAKNKQELLIQMKNSDQIYLIHFDDSVDLENIKKEYENYEEIEAIDYNNDFYISYYPNDEKLPYQNYLNQINALEGWTWSREAEDITIAIIDTGVDLYHPDLQKNIWTNDAEIPDDNIDNDGNGYIDDVYGWDFVNETADNNVKLSRGYNKDAVNHGTAVAGIAAAIGDNQEGIAGIAWKPKIMSLRALDSQGYGNTYNVARAINYAVNNGADIINLSFVGSKSDSILSSAIRRAYQANVAVVAAAGNDKGYGISLDEAPKYPICNDFGENMVFGVGSVDINNKISEFSNFGKYCIDIMAPGENIYSTQVYQPNINAFKEKYGNHRSGSSFSAPLISGTIALIKAIDPNFTLEEIHNLLEDNATDISFKNFSYRKKIGAGLLNINQTLLGARHLKNSRKLSILTIPISGINPDIKFFDQKNDTIEIKNLEKDYYSYKYKIDSGDMDGDGNQEIIISKTNWQGTQISIYDEEWNLLKTLDLEYTQPIDIALGDLYNTKREKIIVGTPINQKPEVLIYDLSGKLLHRFLVYDEKFKGGVSVAVGDVDGDYNQEIITAPANNGGPHIRIFDRNGGLKSQFFAGNEEFRGGLNIDAGNLNKDKKEEIAITPRSNSAPYVLIYDIYGKLLSSFLAYNENFKKEVDIKIADINSDYKNDIITSAGAGGGPHIRIFDMQKNLIKQFFAYSQNDWRGVYISTFIQK